MNRKQFIVAISMVAVVAIAICAGVLYFFGRGNSEGDVVGTKELTTSELSSIRILSSNFLQESGNFGIDLDTMSAATVSQRMQDIANDNGGTSWLKRTEVAGRVASKYIDLSGGFPYDQSKIANADYTDGNRVASFSSGSMDVTPSEKGSYIYTNRNEPILTADVNFVGSSTLSHFAQSTSGIDKSKIENDDEKSTPWDISEQTVPVKGTLIVAQDGAGEKWRVRGIKFDEGAFAMPFWEPAPYTTSYPGTELGGTVVRTVEFPTGEENTDAPE